MRKFFVFLTAIGFAVGMMLGGVTSAIAGSGDLAGNAVNIAAEKAGSYVVPGFTNVYGIHRTNQVTYTLGATYNVNDIITFTFDSCGTFEDTMYYLVTQETIGEDDTWTSAPLKNTVFDMVAVSADKKSVTFRVAHDDALVYVQTGSEETQSALIAGVTYCLVTDAMITPGSLLPEYNPVSNVSCLGSAGQGACTFAGKIDITVESRYGQGLNAGEVFDKTGNKTITAFTSYNQFSASVSKKFDDVIDVYKNRKQFTGFGMEKWDYAWLSFCSDQCNYIDGVEQITISGADQVRITVNGDMTGIASLQILPKPSADTPIYDFTIYASENKAEIVLTPSEFNGVLGTTDFGSADGCCEARIKATVDGETILFPRCFTVDVAFELDLFPNITGPETVVDLLTDEDVGCWTINGMQVKVPYIIIPSDAGSDFVSFVKIVNEDVADALVWMDAYIFNYTDAIDEVPVWNAALPFNIPAESNTTVDQDTLRTTLGLDPAKMYHVELILTISVSDNKANVTAFQKDSVGRTMLPVLYNTGNFYDWRKWQQ